MSSPLLARSEVPYVYREPYILAGYRRPGCSFAQALRYAFVLHNDVGNFWTHFLALLCWLAWYCLLDVDFSDPYYQPLWCFWAGACSCALFSSLAHLFSTISFAVKTVSFVLDYLGIALYTFGAGLASQVYEPPPHSIVHLHKSVYAWAGVVLAVCATVTCTLTRFYWSRYRFVIRILAYVLPFVFAVFPFCQRLLLCVQTGEHCVPETLPLHFFGYATSAMLAFFFITKIPERFAPGRFDFVLHSHQLFHLSAAAQISSQMVMLPRDALIRRPVVDDVIDGDSLSVYVFTAALVGGLVWAGVVWILVAKGYLHSNDKDKRM